MADADADDMTVDAKLAEALAEDEKDSMHPGPPPHGSETEPKTEVVPAASIDDTPVLEIKRQPTPDLTVVRLVEKAGHSAGKLVNLLAKHFPAFRDETRFDGRRVRILKRAQIFVADLWAAFDGQSYGEFDDIGHLTMFAGK